MLDTMRGYHISLFGAMHPMYRYKESMGMCKLHRLRVRYIDMLQHMLHCIAMRVWSLSSRPIGR